jgi:integrase/recombinase XerC
MRTRSDLRAAGTHLLDVLRTTCDRRAGERNGLLGVIAPPAHWSLASLPRALRPFEVRRLLTSFTAALPAPRRGYAIVRCALDLGLRSSEVANLQLTDIRKLAL